MSATKTGPLAEIEAMKAVASALDGLGEGAIDRVLRWALEHYEVPFGSVGRKRLVANAVATDDQHPASTSGEFETAAELMAAAGPKTDAEKVLVVGYWFQVVQNQSDLEAQSINTELKHQGYGVKNITSAFGVLINQKPQLAIQLRKSGTSKQARKKYKLTTAGVQKIDRMLQGTDGYESGGE